MGKEWAGRRGSGVALYGLALLLFLAGCGRDGTAVRLRGGSLAVAISTEGRIASFSEWGSEVELLPLGHDPPLLTLRVGSQDLVPVGATFSPSDSTLLFAYTEDLSATVRIREKPTHIVFTLQGLSDPGQVDLAIWGPYPTTIGETIGETVGVVRGRGFAMGIQALNPRTLGGYPWNENDAMPQLDIFESGDFSDLSEEGKRYVLYRVEAAKPDSFGSTLQAYVRNRSKGRIIPNWGHEAYWAPAFDDGGIVGSAIALFGCREEDALSTLGAIELAEGLPHPTIDGQWGKVAPSASAAYLIMPFSEETLDRAVDVTLEAGLRYLYHPEPFATWGHFPLNEDFPHGREGLAAAVERAGRRGVMLGVHTLSNFITTDDAFVTPTPDPRLARVGSSVLTADVGPGVGEIPVRDPGLFREEASGHLGAAVVGSEIIRYRELSEVPPWTLLGVERGAFGTRETSHASGTPIEKLADHAYRVFLTNPELSVEVAGNLASLFNETGLRQISFDGLEGNRSTGMGNYGEILFTSAWYEALSPEIRRHFIADASRTSHFFWHIYTRMNWGEPWYAGFRESQTEYRMKNQAYFQRNFMPGMLGWFRMTPETSVEDMEWMLARSAAYDAGYGFVTSFETLESNGRTGEILSLMGLWEEARMAGAFGEAQKLQMREPANEFHLEEAGDDGWTLTRIHNSVHRYQNRVRQPGEPSFQTFDFENAGDPQPLEIILSAVGGDVDDIRMEIDGSAVGGLTGRLHQGEILVYDGGDTAKVYSAQWRLRRTMAVDSQTLVVVGGRHHLAVDANVMGGDDAHLKLELRLRGASQEVHPPSAQGEMKE